ncbi:MAG: hypothetical protein K6C08_14065 [Oscillospiraceae bacterium]|nr:hypothetical protein [Oscillospiraceae bacterium]
MIYDKAPYLSACQEAKVVLMDNSAIDNEMAELNREMEVIDGLTKKCIDENSSSTIDKEEYAIRYNGYMDRYETAKSRYDDLAALRSEKLTKAKAIGRFIIILSKRKDLLSEFDNRLWMALVDYAEVDRDGLLTLFFYDGTKITKQIA